MIDSRRCRRGLVDITFTGDGLAVAGTWKDTGTIGAAAPTQIELERAPLRVYHYRKTAGAGPSEYTIVATATGVTVTPVGAADTGVIRIEGVVDAE